MNISDSILSNNNEKLECKKTDLENFQDMIQSQSSLSASAKIEELMQRYTEVYFKEITPVLVQKMLDLILLFLKKFQYKKIPVDAFVKYMIYNSTAKVKFRSQCLEIFKQLYMLVPYDLLQAIGLIILSNQVYFALSAIDIAQYLLTLKQYGPIKVRFEDFAESCILGLLQNFSSTRNMNFKRSCLDLLSQLIKEIGQEFIIAKLETMDYKSSTEIVSELVKKHKLLIEYQDKQSQNQIQSQSDDSKSKISQESTQIQNSPKQQPKISKEQLNTDLTKQIVQTHVEIFEVQNMSNEQSQLKVQVEQQLQVIESLSKKQEKPTGKQNLIQHNKRMAELDKIKSELQFLQKVVFQDYNQFSKKSYKEKFILIKTLYNNLTNGTIKLNEISIDSSTFIQFFQFQNTNGLSLSIKILKIFLMLYESNKSKLIKMYQSSIKEILMLAIKNQSISKSVLEYQVLALFQMVYELKVFNTELFSAILSSLEQENTLIQLNALKTLSNFIMRNNVQNNSQFDQILQLTGEKASISKNPQIRSISLQILIQTQQQIGDKVNQYIGDLRICQLRQFKKAIQSNIPSSEQLNQKEKSKCDEIEIMICQENIKKEDSLISLIQNEIQFYSRKDKNEFSLNYLKIFSTLLQKSNKNVVRNTLKLLLHTHTLFKPSQILKLFDIVINISPSIDFQLYRIVLIQIIQHQGFAMFYSKFIDNLTQKKYTESLVYILRYIIGYIQDTMISEIVELVSKLVEEDNIQLNNLIYHFLALASIQIGQHHVEEIITDNYFMADHLLKKVQREKEKCLYLIKLVQSKKQNQINNNPKFVLVSKEMNFDSISDVLNQDTDQQLSDINECNIFDENEGSKEEDCYSFIGNEEEEEDEI
ncbi:hypothetical protein TTHERM_00922890 (macronuclear) [Tetrahymena thermophila SB210]|uniref:Uncharacterized protein n=1 Tax=Tetrahymena thermophila (strain SB210) TaxID=312017 RepID=Q23WQ6_TETTS|nr:hypothetical protein TTHERM_00922890 [Tetrahymena thermophila SB210]EAS00924.2 hypothetical protein TTHERM_00922890 [Tetrahymena thermophila SB210]|eukprot:XP_001021169.2 hypothetical protein TTHERM_00922890 [Tetrahymena thermophila SB210]